jgi:hypothetical protein
MYFRVLNRLIAPDLLYWERCSFERLSLKWPRSVISKGTNYLARTPKFNRLSLRITHLVFNIGHLV